MKKLNLVGNGKKSISVNNNQVIIVRKGSLLASERQKTIPINNICGVEVKKPGPIINGYIQIQIPGQISGNSSFSTTGGTYNAVTDENSVVFTGKKNYEVALKIKEYIENHMCNQNHQDSKNEVDPVLQIKQLKELFDSDVISQSEFELKKAELLKKI